MSGNACAFADLHVISTLLCISRPLSHDLMDPRLATAVNEHVRRPGAGSHQPMDRQPARIPATAGPLTAAAAISGSDDLEGTLARRTRPRRLGGPRQTLANILGRHQSACSPALREASLLTALAAGRRAARPA